MTIFKKFEGNPIISPRAEYDWEAKAVFNPAAFYENGRVHIIYRAMSEDNTSALGYALSLDGLNINERLTFPIYVPRESFEAKLQPGGNSGCEDPRIVKISDRLYMCYTAYDGKIPPRIALTSIRLKDFLARDWSRWDTPVLISPPGIDDKDASLFPERISDRYYVLHRLGSSIWIDHAHELDHLSTRWLHGHILAEPRKGHWDDSKIGLAAPPFKTKDGWLLLYHGITEADHTYRIGAFLLELNNPLKIIGRTARPLLEPEAPYEKEGLVPNVVFVCGSVVLDETLFIYYGAADKVVGVASASLQDVLGEIGHV